MAAVMACFTGHTSCQLVCSGREPSLASGWWSDDSVLTSFFPTGGVTFGDTSDRMRSLDETQSKCWMSDGGASGVVRLLEASSLETLIGSQHGRSSICDNFNRDRQLRHTTSNKGVAKLMSW
jgi:hypothetical protein